MDQMPSLTNSVNKMSLENVSTILQSESIHQSLRSARIIKDALQEGSTPTSTGTKSASHVRPRANSFDLPSLQLARPMAANGKLQSALKKVQKGQLSSLKETKRLPPSTLVGKKVQVSTEEKDKALSPASLKRKPMERPMADTRSMNPLKRVLNAPLITKSKSVNAVRRSLSYTTQSKDKIPDRTDTKLCTEHTALGTISGEKTPDFEHIEEFDIQQQIPNIDGQKEALRSSQQIEQPFNCLSSSEECTRDVEEVIMLENDEIAEKAETCSRELENVRMMLKKTHEEAKDLLVRALVNNNLLLMLNHPLHEEKIQTIQKYVAGMFAEDCGK